LISTLLKLEISTLLKTITNSCFQALCGRHVIRKAIGRNLEVRNLEILHKVESSAFAFVCLEISNLLKLEISTLLKLENSCLLLFSEGLKFQALEGLKSNVKTDDSS
jgi:hypothetical protein